MPNKDDKLHNSVQAQYGAAISNPKNPLREATGSGKYAGYGDGKVPEGLVCWLQNRLSKMILEKMTSSLIQKVRSASVSARKP